MCRGTLNQLWHLGDARRIHNVTVHPRMKPYMTHTFLQGAVRTGGHLQWQNMKSRVWDVETTRANQHTQVVWEGEGGEGWKRIQTAKGRCDAQGAGLKQHLESSSQERAELNAAVRIQKTPWVCREDTRGYNPKPPEDKHSISGAMPRKERICPTTPETGNQETMQSCKPSGGHFHWGTPRCNTQIIYHWARNAHRKAMMYLPSTQ